MLKLKQSLATTIWISSKRLLLAGTQIYTEDAAHENGLHVPAHSQHLAVVVFVIIALKSIISRLIML